MTEEERTQGPSWDSIGNVGCEEKCFELEKSSTDPLPAVAPSTPIPFEVPDLNAAETTMESPPGFHESPIVSQSDCYVSLWLPTASAEKVRTKTINNCSDPVWNETFYFRIQSQVKNVLELAIFDEDIVQDDDHLTVFFDIAKIPVGETVFMKFQLNPQRREELEVEFTLENSLDLPETIVTNGVVVSREISCLEVQVDRRRWKKKKKHSTSEITASLTGY
ncbi:cytosolic phospholipase A2 epsilon-like [Emydura macquarii macquarii]|uniref:cytosolic phospholipase A2 epsilon-like n=1 Tax=Emydura macquarii macquarii TaxID=1129001 RepID=UPI00352A6428